MAEVLITLGIIGVVAAVTMPTLIQKHREQVTVTKVKKFYSSFSQAYTMAVLENGTIDNWGLQDSEIDEDNDSDIPAHTDASLEEYDKFFTIISKYLKNVEYKKIRNSRDQVGYVLPDGTRIFALWLKPSYCTSGNAKVECGDFYIATDNKPIYDKNGDFNSNVFCFILNPNRIFPRGTSNGEFTQKCLSGTNYSRCTGWVIMNGNMDYLHCNDLSINGKTKCK